MPAFRDGGMTPSGLRDDERRNVLLLATAHGVLGAQVGIHIILGGLAGALLSPDPRFATLPISMMILASAVTTAPISLIMGRFGRRAGFLLGAASGTVAGLVACHAILAGSFAGFLLGSCLIGIYQASQGYLRFAAADCSSESFRPRAISWVLAGGLAAALIGPELVQRTGSLLGSAPYAGAYLALAALNLLGAPLLLGLRLPPPARRQAAVGRPLRQLLAQPPIFAAILCGTVSYAAMNLVMTATPLAMLAIGCTTETAASVVRLHILAMFGPSFFTGRLIARFGHVRVIACALGLFLAAGVVALADNALPNYYVALVLLGVAWNFGFIGATSLLAASHPAADKTRVQGINDTVMFGTVVLASLASGTLLDAAGWDAVQWAMLPAVAVAGASLLPLVARAPKGAWKRI